MFHQCILPHLSSPCLSVDPSANWAIIVSLTSPFAVEKVPTLNLHGVLCGPEGKSYALLSQVVILWYELNSERG